MPKKKDAKKKPVKKKIKKTDVETWLEREQKEPHVREALENASRYFSRGDALTVNTLEAVYGEESSFGVLRRNRGMKGAAGDFHIQKDTAEQYGLTVTEENDQRFNIDYASITAARYLKDLNRFFRRPTKLNKERVTIPIEDIYERKKFVLASYNMGQSYIAHAQQLAQEAGKDPTNWNDVKEFLEAAKLDPEIADKGRKYVDDILKNEVEFAQKSSADKKVKNKRPGKSTGRCVSGHWITKDRHHILICD